MKQGSTCSPMDLRTGTPFLQHIMLFSSMLSVACSLQPLSGSRSYSKHLRYQNQVIGVGNGMPEPKSGCHTGQIWQMSARHALCSSTVDVLLPVGENVHAIELDTAVVHCASVRVAALIMTVVHNYLHELLKPQVIIALVKLLNLESHIIIAYV